eukprot:2077143-Prymnesium_polylepis.1
MSRASVVLHEDVPGAASSSVTICSSRAKKESSSAGSPRNSCTCAMLVSSTRGLDHEGFGGGVLFGGMYYQRGVPRVGDVWNIVAITQSQERADLW